MGRNKSIIKQYDHAFGKITKSSKVIFSQKLPKVKKYSAKYCVKYVPTGSSSYAWKQVGKDLFKSMNDFENENNIRVLPKTISHKWVVKKAN